MEIRTKKKVNAYGILNIDMLTHFDFYLWDSQRIWYTVTIENGDATRIKMAYESTSLINVTLAKISTTYEC